MIFNSTPLPGLLTISRPSFGDERGTFSRLWCERIFSDGGVDFHPTQVSLSTNPNAGTLRGLHWQAEPYAENKLVSVLQGEVFDVAVDLRPRSETFRMSFGVILAERRDALFIPRGFAHGFLTTAPDTIILYMMDVPHQPEAARGARYDDPAFGIDWPATPKIVSPRDLSHPDFGES